MLSVYGGEVIFAGEILHGKTSPLTHDSKGVYANLPQDLPVTRYHSLAGTYATIPECLEVSSWIEKGPDGGKGVIMGIRHKKYIVEGVQFHPESILTAEGRVMLKNFLNMRGGTWEENEEYQKEASLVAREKLGTAQPLMNGTTPKVDAQDTISILEKIYKHRKAALGLQRQVPSQRLSDLQAAYELNLSPALVPFVERLRQSPYRISLMAEIKRASPSKGTISLSTCAPRQARAYALAGASVISVLTEPEWFKGSIEDLRQVRQSLEGMPNRPAILRKEFIFDEYQILEARLAGADTVLLIVKMLDVLTLSRLYAYSKLLGMEPLVEVNTVEEMRTAVELGAQVIGVNNRDLTTFEVDLDTTSRLMDGVPSTTIVCALSGISGPQDVDVYHRNGVGAVLVGEALMRAPDTKQFINNLLGQRLSQRKAVKHDKLLVKICGTRSPEAAKVAIEAGADMVGIIRVEGRSRYVPPKDALEIAKVVHETPKLSGQGTIKMQDDLSEIAIDFFAHTSTHHLVHPTRALLVGVFQNQSLAYVLAQQKLLGLDIVQLHGSEPLEWASLIPVPVIRSFDPSDPSLATRGYHALPLLDSGAGGSGVQLDIRNVEKALNKDAELKIILAGGLNADNLQPTLTRLGDARRQVVAVDVSSGVEESGFQSPEKIRAFIAAAKSVV